MSLVHPQLNTYQLICFLSFVIFGLEARCFSKENNSDSARKSLLGNVLPSVVTTLFLSEWQNVYPRAAHNKPASLHGMFL
jgi:hypothetical protein